MARPRLLTALGVMAIVVFLMGASVSPAAARSSRHFGAKLTTNTQPSNASPAHDCGNSAQSCTWVEEYAVNRPFPPSGIEWARAPRNGQLKKIRLIAADSGSFRLQIAKVKVGTNQARIVRNGPVIHYQGQPDPDAPYVIESFSVNVPIRQGQFLAIRANTSSLLRCDSGGTHILQFQPSLSVGGPLTTASDTDGCYLLLEGILR